MSDTPQILCVDDEENILKSLERMLRLKNYQVFTALSGPEGLKILEKEQIDLVIADQRMPEMNGSEFLRLAREMRPGCVRIMLSGYSDFESLTKAINEGEIFRFISKPWEMDELFEIIEQALNQNRLVHVVGNLVKNICEMTELTNNITVDNCAETGTIQVILENKGNVLSNSVIFDFVNLLLDALGIDEKKRPRTLSGVFSREEESIMIGVSIGKGVILKLKIPHMENVA